MSNYINLAMQNRSAEAMRKKRQKAEIEDALLGGSSGSSGSSESSESSMEGSSLNSSMYQMASSGGSGSLLGSIAAAGLGSMVQYGEEWVKDKVEEKISNAIEKKLCKEGTEKIGKEVGEKVGKEIIEGVGEKALKEGTEGVAKWGIKKLGKELAEKVVGYGAALLGGPVGWAAGAAMFASDVYDYANLACLLLAGDDLDGLLSSGVPIDIQGERDALHQQALDEGMSETEAARLSYQATAGLEQAQAFSDMYNSVKDTIAKHKEEKKKKKEMAEAEKAKKEAEEKLAQEEAERKKKEEEEKQREEEEENEDEADGESDGKSAVKKGLTKGLTHTLGTLGGTMGISLSMIGIYKVHYTGEFEYKGISAEYQSANHTFQNFVDYDKNGDVVLKGLTKENKLIKTFYTKYSDKSYYAIVEDSSKYGKNMDDAYLRKNLLTPDELREQYPDIEDVNGREAMFQLNPDVLYVLDKYIHEDKVLYPQQFVKPVFYEESQENFALKDLVSDTGKILAKSQMFDNNGKPLKNSDGSFKTTEGIWDYGFASVLRYKEYDVKRREVTAPVKREVKEYATDSVESKGDVVAEDKKPISGSVPNASSVTKNISNREKPAYIIDSAVTPGGTITTKIEQAWQKSAEPSLSSNKVSYYSVKTGEVKKCTSSNPNDTGSNTPESSGPNIPGSSVDDISSPHKSRETTIENGETCTVLPTYTIYEVTDHFETYIEEEVPQYGGEPSSEGINGSEYFRDYMSAYSNYYPQGLPSRLDFKVLENEELQSLIYDDDPNAFGTGGTVAVTGTAGTATEDEFKNAIFFGDSITVGLGNSIPSAKTVAEGGYTAEQGYDKLIDKVISQKPPVVVVSFGANDAGYKKPDWFKDNYTKLINKLKSDIPGVKIYINKIFPGDLTKPNSSQYKASIENIPEHNGLLSTIASTTGATLIDCTNIPDLKSYYTNDGLHFKDSFNTLWYNEMKKQIVGTTSSVAPNGATTGSSSRTAFNMRTVSVQLPNPTAGESRSVAEVIQLGVNKDDPCSVKAVSKYLPLFEHWGNTYGVDPYLLAAMSAGESCADPNLGKGKVDRPGVKDGAKGIMQIEDVVKEVKAFNQQTGQVDVEKIPWNDDSIMCDANWGIKFGAMQASEAMSRYNYQNIPAGLTSYNLGEGGMAVVANYYLSGGTATATNFNALSKEEQSQAKAYLEMNHNGWLTATYPGDLPAESTDYALYKDPNDGVHDARTWYRENAKQGTAHYVEHNLRFYAGDGSPWVMNEAGEVITLDGAASSNGGSGGGTPLSMFNSYLKSNWETIMEKWDDLFPGQSELDKKLDIVKKGDYTQLYSNYEAKARAGAKSTAITIPRSSIVDAASMNKVDTQLALNMMFALNQGNYLFKYDNMTEAEWKAMYTQLLSSPTGQVWDDKWIGFTIEDIFGIKDIEDLGTLFPEDIGVSPTIAVPYGNIKNNISGDENLLSQYNAMNFGIDVVVPPDTDVLTVADGKVVSISKRNDVNSRYGNYVKIQHAKGTVTLTGNLKTVKVKVGDEVKKGDVIGTSGGACRSYKDNAVHYQIIHNGTLINPTWVITREMTGFEDPIKGNANTGVVGGTVLEVSNIELVNRVIAEGKKHIGKPYVWGAQGPNNFDCSGFIFYIMKEAGVPIKYRETAYSFRHRKDVIDVPRDQVQPGDLIFWHDLTGKKHSPVFHIGIYAGNDEVLDCSPDHKGVGSRKLSALQDKPGDRYFTFGRFELLSGGSATPTPDEKEEEKK